MELFLKRDPERLRATVAGCFPFRDERAVGKEVPAFQGQNQAGGEQPAGPQWEWIHPLHDPGDPGLSPSRDYVKTLARNL